MKRTLILLSLFLIPALALAQGAGTNYNEQGGATTVIGGALEIANGGACTVQSGGSLTIESGGALAVASGATFTSAATTTALSGALTVAGASTLAGDLTVSADSSGGDNFAYNTISGKLKLSLVSLAAGTNGSVETTLYTDDSPAGEWTAVDADVVVSTSTTHIREGAGSLKLAFAATAAATDGAVTDITNDDLEANESIGFWIYSDVALTAGDLVILIDDTDASPDQTYNVPAVTANSWQWVEVDISALAAGTGNVVDKVGVVLSTAGALAQGAFNVWIDTMYKWDASDEEALGDSIIQDGILSVLSLDTANTGTHSFANLIEHTNYFTHYQASNDAIVWITDRSAASAICLYLY